MVFQKRDEALKELGTYHIIEEHSDGDLTIESKGTKYVVTTEGQIFREIERDSKTPIEHEMTVWLLLHSIPYAHGSPGIVVDADVAARTPCTVYSVDGSELVFSKGIVGALGKEQKEAYCPTKVYKRSEGIERRLRNWKEAVAAAQEKIKGIPKGERLEPWLKAMSEELGKRGIET